MQTMENIYLDNAATTSLSPEVLDAMMPYLLNEYGNPSSVHKNGRNAKLAIENARRSVASLLGVHHSTIYFTSGGTESNNMVIAGMARSGYIRYILTSATEHHAVLHPVEKSGTPSTYLAIDEYGRPCLDDLKRQLKKLNGRCLVSLMAANNETGVLTDVNGAAKITLSNNGLFHTDAVQYIGHYPMDLSAMPIHFASASGHKFHGPKGTGILYIKEGIELIALIDGGGQEKNMRSGTENVAGIAGFAKALEIAMRDYETHKKQLRYLRNHLKKEIKERIPAVVINEDPNEEGLYTILSVSIPFDDEVAGITLLLDQNGVSISGGSACSGGSVSHVMKALGRDKNYETLRFSFSRYNKAEEILAVIRILNMIYKGVDSI